MSEFMPLYLERLLWTEGGKEEKEKTKHMILNRAAYTYTY